MRNPDWAVNIPWPHYPTVTPGGKVSRARTAGKPMPWLSANVVNGLPHRVYRMAVKAWRNEAEDAVDGGTYLGPFPVHVHVVLSRRRGYNMDVFAVLEGVKPILDGLVLAEAIPGDEPRYVASGSASVEKAPEYAVRVELLALKTEG